MECLGFLEQLIMSLIADVDLLLIEPSVFTAAAAASTNLLTVADAAVSGTVLSSASSNFATAGIDEGHVAVVGDEALEIVERLANTQLDVSRPRASSSDEKIVPSAGTGLTLKINSFARLIDQTQNDLFQALALREDDPDLPLDESDIVNPAPLARLIALRTIERGFALASALDVEDDSLSGRAAHYAALAGEVADSLAVLLDPDGDGQADESRHVRVSVLRRV